MTHEENSIDISDSRVNVWNFCPRSWGLQYVEGWQRKVKPPSLSKGTMFHAGVQEAVNCLSVHPKYMSLSADEIRAYFGAVSPETRNAIIESFEAQSALASDDWLDEMAEQRDIAAWMVGHYLHFLANLLAHKMILGIEEVFSDEIRLNGFRPLNNRGAVDLILFDPFTNTVHIIDHKSTREILTADERLSYSQQLIGYLRWAKNSPEILKRINEKFPDVKQSDLKYRTELRVVRNIKPREPKVLVNGNVSSAGISTIREVYEAGLARQASAPTEKQIARLESLPESWHTTIEQMFSDDDIAAWELELSVQAERMEQARKLPMYRTKNTSNCPECALKIVCKFGGDPDFEQRKEENDATT
jgi:hypothetical protein